MPGRSRTRRIKSSKEFVEWMKLASGNAGDQWEFATVTSQQTGGVRVSFDGDIDDNLANIETAVTFPYLGFQPIVGDRVLMRKIGRTWVCMGALSGGNNSFVNGSISRAATQTFTSSTTASTITWDTGLGAKVGCSGGSTGITVQAMGTYDVLCGGVWGGNATARRVFWPFVNGAQYGSNMGDTAWPNNTDPARQVSKFTVDVNAGDLISVWAFQNSGVSLTLTAFLEIVKIAD